VGGAKGLSVDLIHRLGVAREWGESQEREAEDRQLGKKEYARDKRERDSEIREKEEIEYN